MLAFPTVEAANYATLLVDQHAAKLRAYYCEVCAPLPTSLALTNSWALVSLARCRACLQLLQMLQ